MKSTTKHRGFWFSFLSGSAGLGDCDVKGRILKEKNKDQQWVNFIIVMYILELQKNTSHFYMYHTIKGYKGKTQIAPRLATMCIQLCLCCQGSACL